MEIIDITKLIETYGIKGTIFIVILYLIFTLIKGKWMSKLFSKVSDFFIERFMKNKSNDLNIVRSITDSDITNHDIFNYIDFWTYSKVPTFQFSTEYRTAVFRKYLTIYLKSYKKNISDFTNSKEYQEMDEAKLHTTLLNLINRVVYDYERESQEFGIPKIIIDKM